MELIAAHGLRKRFNLEAGFFAPLGRYVYAVNGVSFSIGENESYGLVGESGCGKSTTARLLVRMYERSGGEIRYRGTDIAGFKKRELCRYREKVRYVFQDPARSLNPRMSVYHVLTDSLRWPARRWPGRAEGRRRAACILEETGLSAADLDRRPAEFSGGQRQRISIARGLLAEPELLICDEVVSALDVSVQGQILNLLLSIRARRGISFLFIAHDLRAASWFCDRIGVMYRGELVEEAPAAGFYKNALHPYTRLLFSSAKHNGNPPKTSPADRREIPETKTSAVIFGEVNPSFAEPSGCAFSGRCPRAETRCFREKPAPYAEAGRMVRCFMV